MAQLFIEILKYLMPLIFKFIIYQTGKQVGKSEAEKKFIILENKFWKEQNEKLKQIEVIRKDNSNLNIDDIVNGL